MYDFMEINFPCPKKYNIVFHIWMSSLNEVNSLSVFSELNHYQSPHLLSYPETVMLIEHSCTA